MLQCFLKHDYLVVPSFFVRVFFVLQRPPVGLFTFHSLPMELIFSRSAGPTSALHRRARVLLVCLLFFSFRHDVVRRDLFLFSFSSGPRRSICRSRFFSFANVAPIFSTENERKQSV